MRTIWQALAWKEWHEHKWKLASVTTIVLGVSSVPVINYEWRAFSLSAAIIILCIAPLAMFIGASTATSERARGTLAFTQALPVPMWHIALQKLIAGLLTCIIPIGLALAFYAALYFIFVYVEVEPVPFLGFPLGTEAGAISLKRWFHEGFSTGSIMAASLFLWTAAIGVNRRDEVSAAAWSLAALVAWWMAIILVPAVFDWRFSWQDDWFVPVVVASSPGGYATFAAERVSVPTERIANCFAALIPIITSVLFLTRFGGLESSQARSLASAFALTRRLDWLDRPMKSPISALAWKQVRESGPIALAGIAGVFGTSLAILIAGRSAANMVFVSEVVAGTTLVFGAVATLVVGIGIFLHDLSPMIHTFWRSRPIEVNLWFWTKFAVGLLVLATAFVLPLAIVVVSRDYRHHPDFHEFAIWTLLLPVWIYSASVLTTVLVRQAVYAGVLSWAAMYLSVLIVVGILRGTQLAKGSITWKELTEPTTGEMAAAMILASIVFTIIAWLAVRNDWGRKSRY